MKNESGYKHMIGEDDRLVAVIFDDMLFAGVTTGDRMAPGIGGKGIDSHVHSRKIPSAQTRRCQSAESIEPSTYRFRINNP